MADEVSTGGEYTANSDRFGDYSQSAGGAFAETPGMLFQAASLIDSAAYFNSLSNPSYSAETVQVGGIETLPSVPRAFLMGLTGFVCVSLVRDRRLWASAVILIFVLSQIGIHALPRLTARLSNSNLFPKETIAANVYPSILDESSDCGELFANRKYIGLLRRLAGSPDSAGIDNHGYLGEKLHCCAKPFLSAPGAGQPDCQKTDRTLSRSIMTHRELYPDSCLPLSLTDQNVTLVFSPAFIFSNISRAPPRRNEISSVLCFSK